ncbi:MAG TPA: glycosyltransferase [Pseudonocardiaceae bacterium]|nr:glycosyltransferase [Pseudonocardiaceae bacterium]
MAEPGRGRTSVVACTVVTRGRLPAARVLARSYLRHHPGHDVVVLVADAARFDDAPDHTVHGYDWLALDPERYFTMATCCTAEELTTAVTPLLVRQLLDRYDAVVALAPDGHVLAPFPEVAQSAVDTGIVLAPRMFASVPATKVGGFDPGFIAVGRPAKSFVDFWVARALADVLRPVPRTDTEVVERTWLDDVPALFQHEVLRDPASPVRFAHFPGYDPDQPWLLGTDRPPVLLSRYPAVRALSDAYRTELLAERDGVPEPYGFAALPDGTPITAPMRGLFRAALLAAERVDDEPNARADELPPHPFGPDTGTGLQRWLRSPSSPAQACAGFNRLTMWVWSGRVDLRSAFPHPLAQNADAYRQWCRTHGITDGPLPVWALPVTPRSPAPPVDEFGVNLAGYLTAELGLGEMGRILHSALLAADVPVVAVVEDHSLGTTVGTGLAAPETVGRPRFPVSVIAVNADYTELVLASHPEIGHRRHRIGLWAWELEDFPAAHRNAFGLVDEVWTISEFCRTSIAAHATVPVKVFPVPIADPGPPQRKPWRPGDPIQFLFAFDFNSTGQRKNPWGVVTAFQRAFPGRDDVRLVIKTINARQQYAAAERLRYLIGDDHRIELVERYLTAAELDDCYATSTAYVSLHRSEGFGLTVAEAMVRGLPAICTDYSATTEFVPPDAGWLIPHTMSEVGDGWPPYPPDGRWAEPDLAAATAAMRAVADDPVAAAGRGAMGRAHILRTRSMDVAATWVREQLTAAHRNWRDHKDGRFGPTDPLELAMALVHSGADPGAPSRIPFAPAMRRLVRRAINHYDAHQRKILGALADGVREARTRQDQRLDALSARLDSLERLEQRTPGDRARP